MLIIASVVIALVAVSVCVFLAISPFASRKIGRMTGTPEQNAVRAWLDERGGGYTELTWSPPIDTADLLLCQRRRDVEPFVIFDCKELKPGTFIQLKYTEKNGFGHVVQCKTAFLVQGGGVLTVDAEDIRYKSESEKEWWNRTRPSPIADEPTPMEHQAAEQQAILNSLNNIAGRMKEQSSGPQRGGSNGMVDVGSGSGGLSSPRAQLPKSHPQPKANMPGMPGYVPPTSR